MYGRHVHPAMLAWWRQRQSEAQQEATCGPGGGEGWQAGHRHGGEDDGGGGGFGVRRPLRFLAYKLDLSEPQIAELAKILNELKTERAQAAVDDRRVTAAFADAIAGDTFDAAKTAEAATGRVKTQEKLAEAVKNALAKIHATLDKEQRERLAYLIRTGTLAI
jgi:Spy/CpxP family protein refolding chaperone